MKARFSEYFDQGYLLLLFHAKQVLSTSYVIQ